MIIYSRYNSSRKKEFQLLTIIEKDESGALFASKRAQTKEAIPFLNSLRSKYSLLAELSFSIKPLKIKRKDDTRIDFEFSHYKSLANLLLRALADKDLDDFTGILESYIGAIRKNKICKQPLSDGFREIFGGYEGEDLECLYPGCLDLDFDNIKYNKENGDYFLLEYEWTFDFPIPYQYIIFRALNDFYCKNQSYNPHELVRLGELLDRFGIKERETFIRFEYNFQKFVLGENLKQDYKSYKKFLDSIENGNYFSESQKFVSFDQMVQKKDFEILQKNQRISELEKNIEQNKQFIQQKKREAREKEQIIQERDRKIINLTGELKLVKSSKFWKLREKYLRLKSYFSKRKDGK